MKRIITLFLILTLGIIVPLSAVASDGYADGYMMGKSIGIEESPTVIDVVGGLGLGAFYVIGTAIFDAPPPSNLRLMSIADETNEYQMGFIDGYEKGYKNTRIANASIGWGLAMIILFSMAGY